MTTLAITLECVEHLDLIHLHIKEMAFCLVRTRHQSCVGHIAMNLLNDETLWALRLVLVGALGVHLVLPLSLALLIDLVAFADVGHDVVDGLVDTTLTCT